MKKIMAGIVTALCVGVVAGATTTNFCTADAAKLVYDREKLQNPPACFLSLEEGKVKNMTDWEYCRVDDEYDAWYFYGDGSATDDNNPEVRFVADGVQTIEKPYTLTPITVSEFSFEYCIENTAPAGVVDIPQQDYIVQILGADTLYPIIIVDINADGDWHTITVDSSTAFYRTSGGNATTYGEYQDNFCGFIFKMGGLDGEFMIRNITVYDAYGMELLPEIDESEDDGGDESLSEEVVESNDESSSITSVESVSSTASVQEGTTAKKGCGSFGVGTMGLATLTAAGVVLGVSKKKRR